MRSGRGERSALSAARARLAELIVGSIFINVLAVALPIFSMQIYDRVLPGKAAATLTVLAAGALVAIGLEIALRLARADLISQNGAAFERNLSRAAINHALNSSVMDGDIQTASQKLQKMQAVRSLRDFHSGYAVTVLIDFAFVFLYLALVMKIGGLVVLAPLAIVTLIIINGLVGGLKLRDTITARKNADNVRYEFLVSTLQSISALKCFALGGLFARRYEPLEYKTSLANFEVSRTSAQILNTSMVLGNLMTAVVVTLGVTTAVNSGLSIGALIACVLLSGRLIPPLQRGIILWIKYQEYDASRTQFLSLFETPQERGSSGDRVSTGGGRLLELHGVTIARRRAGAPLLASCSAAFDAGDLVQVRAESARQASQVLRVVAGLAGANEGAIFINGKELDAVPMTRRAEHVGYLAASAELFNGTILDNLTSFGIRDQRRALEVARSLGIDRDVAQMPSGWNTVISGRLSDEAPTGLRQRIAIARVLAARPKVVLFDEAAELLDNRSYDLLISTLISLRQECVILFNTTDENLLGLCNRQLVLRPDGRTALFGAGRLAQAVGRGLMPV